MNIRISEDLLEVLGKTHERSVNILKKYISEKVSIKSELLSLYYEDLVCENTFLGFIKYDIENYIKYNVNSEWSDEDKSKLIKAFIRINDSIEDVIKGELENIESKYELKPGEKNGVEKCIYNYVVELREIASHVDVIKKILKIFLEIIEKKKDDNIEDEFECCSYGETTDGCPLNSMGRELGLDGFALTDSEKEVFCRF